MVTNFELSGGYRRTTTGPDSYWYCRQDGTPYASKQEAMDTVPVGLRPLRTVNVAGAEYIWLNGTTIDDLVKKGGDASQEITDPLIVPLALRNVVIQGDYDRYNRLLTTNLPAGSEALKVFYHENIRYEYAVAGETGRLAWHRMWQGYSNGVIAPPPEELPAENTAFPLDFPASFPA